MSSNIAQNIPENGKSGPQEPSYKTNNGVPMKTSGHVVYSYGWILTQTLIVKEEDKGAHCIFFKCSVTKVICTLNTYGNFETP